MNTQFTALASEAKKRQQAILDQLPNQSIVILWGAEKKQQSNDVDYFFRQENNFFYLCPLDEPNLILLLIKQDEHHTQSYLFRQPLNSAWETVANSDVFLKESLKLSYVLSKDNFKPSLTELIQESQSLWASFSIHGALAKATDLLQNIPHRIEQLHDLDSLITPMRLKKSAAEITLMKQSAQITIDSYQAVIPFLRAGLSEFDVQNQLQQAYWERGADTLLPYPPIVASGISACTLHHTPQRNNRLKKGEALLIDSGASVHYYTTDITRVYPVEVPFNNAQRAVYDQLFKVQTQLIDAVKPMTSFQTLNQLAHRLVAEALIELGLIQQSLEDCLAEKTYERFYMHRVGHFLGMDVHDVGYYHASKTPQDNLLEADMILTIEPGIYIPSTSDIPEQWHGIGMRLEDDILVTPTGHEDLTQALPKSYEAMFSWIKNA